MMHATACKIAILLVLHLTLSSLWGDAPDLRWHKAHQLEATGNFSEAVQEISEALKTRPLDPEYLAYLGHLQYQLKEYDSALKSGLKAVQLNPNIGWYFVLCARAAHAQGDFTRSQSFAKKALSFGPQLLGAPNYKTVSEILADFYPYVVRLTWTISKERFIRQDDSLSVDVAVPLQHLDYQDSKISVSNAKIKNERQVQGNRVLTLEPFSARDIVLETTITRRPQIISHKIARVANQNDLSLPAESEQYLHSSYKVDLEGKTLKQIASQLQGRNQVIIIKNILDWMSKNLSYKISEFSSAEEVVRRGFGECWAWSSVFTALARLNGIPARNVWGPILAPGFAPAGQLKGHTWVEVYLPTLGWVPLDPQFPQQLGLLPHHYLRVAHSLDDGWGAVMNLPDLIPYTVLSSTPG